MIPSGCRVRLPVTSPTSAAFPKRFKWVGFPESFRKETSCGMNFEIVAIPYVQASWFVHHPGLPCRCVLTRSQDSCDFYTRANHASSPMHASGMLAAYTGNWRRKDFHLTRLAAMSAATNLSAHPAPIN